jgi:hypothetical protein
MKGSPLVCLLTSVLLAASVAADTPASNQSAVPAAAGVDFGPNVLVFDPSMATETMQAKVDEIFKKQEKAHFTGARYAILFKPGSYQLNVRVGFFTHVAGLGASPDDVAIKGHVKVDARWARGMALVNFWRTAENLSVTPEDGKEMWAVSQASPIRRLHIRGDLLLWDGGWSSGGFASDLKVDGLVNSGTQQQWLTRNSEIGSWTGSNWNMDFVGVKGAPANSFPKPPYAVIDRAPVTREKPFLRIDGHGSYDVFVPALQTNSLGATWTSGPAAGTAIPIEAFYIAKPADTAEAINAALRAGKHLLLTPGVYHLTDTIHISRPDTVVLGLGIPTLVAEHGITALAVDDVDGVKICGVLIDAGEKNSPVLMQVGPNGSHADHAKNPTSLHDVFVRLGGQAIGKADVSLEINSRNVIGDDFWLWRADHGKGSKWTENTAANGLVVNGDDVTIYGLAVEHYQQYQTIWNANGGRVYFYQCEIPYDVPNQASWNAAGHVGYAGYKVADSVKSHEAWGLGLYCNFTRDPSVKLGSAIEAPKTDGVKFHDMITVSLGGGKGEITHVVNDVGATAKPGHVETWLTVYP